MKHGILFAITIFFSSIFHAQKVNVFHHFDEQNISLRWQINDTEAWNNSLLTGFLLTRKNLSTGNVERFEISNTTAKYLDIDNDSTDQRYILALLLSPSSDHRSFLDAQFDEDEIDLSNIDIVRRLLSEYILNTNYALILESGFGFQDGPIDLTNDYEYKLTNLRPVLRSENRIEHTFSINSQKISSQRLPEIESQWGNKQVTLKWNTAEFNDIYYGYELQQSMDGGTFELLDSLIINPMDTSSEEAFHFIYDRRFLDDNDAIYTFRIYGRDYLGLKSETFNEVSGSGNPGIGVSPQITSSELLNTNQVVLHWSINERFKDNVQAWHIYVGENWDGPYQIDTTGVDATTNRLTRDLPFENNYFRVVAVDENLREHSSFPTLVTHLDTIAPAIPNNLTGFIDSLGIVKLDWDDNTEKDFYGYKVFFGFDTTREMTLANFKAIAESSFTDTVGLKSMNRKLYYKVTAVDDRNNRSPFSKIIYLVKPDVISPMEPNFHTQKPGPGSARLAWYKSTSGDVVQQQLFRRALEIETDWTLIKTWENEPIDTSFIDNNLAAFESYAYILTVRDSSGNTSLPSTPAIVKILPDHRDLNLENWQLEVSDDYIEIEHFYSDQEIYEIRIFKKEADGKPFEVTKLDISTFSFRDDHVKKDSLVEYFIQVVFQDGYRSKFSPRRVIRFE